LASLYPKPTEPNGTCEVREEKIDLAGLRIVEASNEGLKEKAKFDKKNVKISIDNFFYFGF